MESCLQCGDIALFRGKLTEENTRRIKVHRGRKGKRVHGSNHLIHHSRKSCTYTRQNYGVSSWKRVSSGRNSTTRKIASNLYERDMYDNFPTRNSPIFFQQYNSSFEGSCFFRYNFFLWENFSFFQNNDCLFCFWCMHKKILTFENWILCNICEW